MSDLPSSDCKPRPIGESASGNAIVRMRMLTVFFGQGTDGQPAPSLQKGPSLRSMMRIRYRWRLIPAATAMFVHQ